MPTMPVAPKITTFMSEGYSVRQRQRAITLSRQSKQCVDDRGRDRWNGRFTASGRLVAARDDVHVDRGRRVLHVRRLKAVEVSLFDAAVLERDGALCHELTQSEDHAALALTLNRQRIDGHAHVDRHGGAMNARPIVLD